MPAEVRYVEGYFPGVIGKIAQVHGEYYATLWTQGCKFEATVARELAEFCEAFVVGRDFLLSAFLDEQWVGAIAIDGAQTVRPGAQLRWLLVKPEARGFGIGQTLARQAVEFCREAGFELISLWTVAGLAASRKIYDQLGFEVVEQFLDDRYSAELEVLRMVLSLKS